MQSNQKPTELQFFYKFLEVETAFTYTKLLSIRTAINKAGSEPLLTQA